MSASRPRAAGVAPASTNRPAAASAAPPMRARSPRDWLWLMSSAPTTSTTPPPMPYRMIVVRRMSANRLPQYQRPAKNTTPSTTRPAEMRTGSKPPTSSWSSKRGSGALRQLEQGLAGVQAQGRVDGDPGRRQQPDVRPGEQRQVAS